MTSWCPLYRNFSAWLNGTENWISCLLCLETSAGVSIRHLYRNCAGGGAGSAFVLFASQCFYIQMWDDGSHVSSKLITVCNCLILLEATRWYKDCVCSQWSHRALNLSTHRAWHSYLPNIFYDGTQASSFQTSCFCRAVRRRFLSHSPPPPCLST